IESGPITQAHQRYLVQSGQASDEGALGGVFTSAPAANGEILSTDGHLAAINFRQATYKSVGPKLSIPSGRYAAGQLAYFLERAGVDQLGDPLADCHAPGPVVSGDSFLTTQRQGQFPATPYLFGLWLPGHFLQTRPGGRNSAASHWAGQDRCD